MSFKEKKFPQHIGIIMDGNGRWATRRGLSRLVGHKEGVEAIKRTINHAVEFNIKYITFFAFSTENWKRDKSEIDGIFQIVRDYIDKNTNELFEKGIKIVSMGDLSKIPTDLNKKLQEIIKKTKTNNKLIVNLAINYGARDEIAFAFNNLIKQGKTEVSTQDISKSLYTKNLPDPDLIIRTGGEQRLSNFMLFQCAYSELYFTKTFWPSFDKKHFKKALKEYSNRDRRFGGDHKNSV